MLSKIYLEITNVCNLSCPFCHGTKRKRRFMPYDDFALILDKIKGKAKYLYFHVLGEPFLHPDLARMMAKAHECGFTVMLTTNGTRLAEGGEKILDTGVLRKISISLQALESGGIADVDAYLESIARFSAECGKRNVICVLRLWNGKSEGEKQNERILQKLHALFPDEWIPNRSGCKLVSAPLGQNEIYLENADRFRWPDERSEYKAVPHACRAIRDQIGILCDGTVVPCCMDADGAVPLGNLLSPRSLEEILSSPRAENLCRSFEKGAPCETLCASCGYAERFSVR